MGFLLKLGSFVVIGCSTYGAIYFGHQALVPEYNGKEILTGKTVLITGATSGIGKSTAMQLANRNAKVILGCRDQDKCIWTRREIVEKTKNEQVFCSLLDLSSLQSINEFVQRMKSKEINFDILINNAGVMRCPQTYTKEGFEMQLGVNHLGHFYLTHLLLDDLIKQKARIINVTASAYRKGKINLDDLNSAQSYNPTHAYNQSKLANILFTKELASQLQGSGAYVYAADPGACNTDLTRHMSISKSIFGRVLAKPWLKLLGRSPNKGSQVIVYCALSPELSNDQASGKLYHDNKPVDLLPHAQDDIMAKKLWLISDRWTVNRDKPSNINVVNNQTEQSNQVENLSPSTIVQDQITN